MSRVEHASHVPATAPGHAVLPGVVLRGPPVAGDSTLLGAPALAFVADLERRFGARRRQLLEARRARQERLDQGERPAFLPDTAAMRSSPWTAAPLPSELQDRRVEITGPVERKLVINALNSGANVFMADFEDSTSPTWDNLVQGQVNLMGAVRRRIEHVQPGTGKRYRLAEKTAVLFVRPRGWHLPEAHLLVDGEPVSASLFDFGLYLFHNAAELRARGSGPYFYLPKLESHREARLWNDVFVHSQRALGLARGTIKATVLIETVLAAFEMDEILFELREHSAGLNCGRWDYIFSVIKRFAQDPAFLLPDRATVGMTSHFLRSYSRLLIHTCHRRGVHAMGGMAAQIPIKDDPAAHALAMDKVRADKLREVTDGHDGTWVAHPGLVELAREVFDAHMPGPHQIHRRGDKIDVTPSDLLSVPAGTLTLAGLRQNVEVGVSYLAAWLAGNGCVPLHDLMEDAATAEISRSQIWQGIRHGARLAEGHVIDADLVGAILTEELAAIRDRLGAARFDAGTWADAADLFLSLSTRTRCEEFLTLPAYERLLARTG